MKKTTVALVIAALMAVAANPAFACGHSGGYRAAQAVKNPAHPNKKDGRTQRRQVVRKDPGVAVRDTVKLLL